MSVRVMVVDDSLTIRMDLKDAFGAADIETVLCASIAEARRSIHAERPSLIVLDVLLPDGNGVDFLAELRKDSDTKDIPVLMLSSESEVKDRIRGRKQGADDYVGKPYDAGHVVTRGLSLIGTKGAGSAHPMVLLIDDSQTFLHQMNELLQSAGFRTTLAVNGEDGLRRAAETQPDAIVVDGIMPGIDGPTVIRRLRLDPGLNTIPCLLMTASEGATDEVSALDSGADAYVRKGESGQVVLTRLHAMLRSAEQSRERTRTTALASPKRVLAVDDSLTYLEELTEHLRRDGYEVVKAKSGEEALELLSVEQVDCILLDLMMPGLSGTETCRRIKGSSAARNVPLIMLTALDEQDAMVEGINAGADDYVTKAADFEVLRARLRAQLRRKHFEDENRKVREEIMHKEAETQAARKTAQAKADLVRQLELKHAELELLNKELQSFAYSVSHDLRQPLRSMDGFSKVLIDQYGGLMDERGRHYLARIRAGAQRMGSLIDGLLTLSRVTRREINRGSVDLSAIARRVFQRLADAEPSRTTSLKTPDSLVVDGDELLLETVLENLLGNAWKFTSRTPDARIEIGVEDTETLPVYFVKDNGVGFNMEYAEKLFGPFQRLHSEEEFAGTGIGLATVQRIIHRHGGRIWAEGKPGEGAVFRFTIAGEPAEKALT